MRQSVDVSRLETFANNEYQLKNVEMKFHATFSKRLETPRKRRQNRVVALDSTIKKRMEM